MRENGFINRVTCLLLWGCVTMTAVQGQSGNTNLPVAVIGRTNAASVIADDKWLLLGGSVRSWTTSGQDANSTAQANTIATTVSVFDLNSKTVKDVQMSAGPDGVNRLNSTSQTCEYDAAGEHLVYCFGGRSGTSYSAQRPLQTGIGVLNPVDMTWQQSAETSIPLRWGHSSVRMGKAMYIFGGWGNQQTDVLGDLWSVTLPDVTSNRLSETGSSSAPLARAWHCAAPMNSTTFLLLGGVGVNNLRPNDAWTFNVQNNAWTNVTSLLNQKNLPLNRTGQGCGWAGGKVWVFGGADNGGTIYSDLWSISVDTLQPVRVNSANLARRHYRRQSAATGVPSGRVYMQTASFQDQFAVFGGQDQYSSSLGDWIASDRALHFYQARNGPGGWASDTAGISALAAAEPSTADIRRAESREAVYEATCGNSCTMKGLAGALFAIIGLAAGLGLLAALFLAARERRRVRQNRALYGKTGQQGTSGNRISRPMQAHAHTPGGAALLMSSATNGKPVSRSQSVRSYYHDDEAHINVTPIAAGAAGLARGTPITPHRRDSRKGLLSKFKGSNEASGKRYKCLWPHVPNMADELPVEAGDVVEEKRAFEDGWALAVNRSKADKMGMIPKNILQQITDNAEGAPSAGVAPRVAVAGAILANLSNTHSPETPQRRDSRKQHHGEGSDKLRHPHSAHRNLGKRHRCMWAHEATLPDELDVAAGDIVEERRSFSDGWVMVINKSCGDRVGMVPRNILQDYHEDDDSAATANIVEATGATSRGEIE